MGFKTKGQLELELERFKKESRPLWVPDVSHFEIEIKFKDELIASWNDIGAQLTIHKENERIHKCLNRAGLLDVEIDFLPSSTFLLPNGLPISMSVKSSRFESWFNDLINSKQPLPFLLPDTGIILNRYISNILFHNLEVSIRLKLQFRIPRLVVLELERQSNDKDIRKRMAYDALGDILHLNYQMLPRMKPDIISKFSDIAGKGFADSLIRFEVEEFRLSPTWKRPKPSTPHNILFLCCDLANALAASAEDLPTLYFAREPFDKKQINVPFDLLSDLLYIISVEFDSICLVLKSKGKKEEMKISSMWSGKTAGQWRDCVMCDNS